MKVRALRLLTAAVCLLAIQAAASHWLRRDPHLPSPPSLAALPLRLGDWIQTHEESIDPGALQMLEPDDVLARGYQLTGGREQASLFVAYYKTQLRSKNAHDPKVCLPGAGWNPTVSRVIEIPLASQSRSIPANYFRIARDGNQAVVLYWFQTYNGIYTYEQQLRLHRLLDAVVENRTDMALVRIVVPIGDAGVPAADARAAELARLLYPHMLPYFPPKEKTPS